MPEIKKISTQKWLRYSKQNFSKMLKLWSLGEGRNRSTNVS